MISFQPFYSSFQPHDALFGDDQLEQRVLSYLVNQAGIRGDQISVSASAGRVTLRGTVATRANGQLLQACCLRVAGVRNVQNELTVFGPKRWAAPRTIRGRRPRWNNPLPARTPNLALQPLNPIPKRGSS